MDAKMQSAGVPLAQVRIFEYKILADYVHLLS